LKPSALLLWQCFKPNKKEDAAMLNLRSIATTVSCIVALACFTGCAVINPYVSADDTAVAAKPSLANAVAYAEDTRNTYECAVSEYTWMNRTVGVTLIGAAAAAAAVGITGGSTDVITGLGVGGAALFGIDRLLYREARLRAYTEGAKAIGCTLTAFAPLRTVELNDPNDPDNNLDTLLAQLLIDLGTLESALKSAPQAAHSFEFIEGTRILQAGKDTLGRGRTAQSALAVAGIRLYESVEGIRSEVNKALLSSEPDVQELVQGLSQFIPANAALIAPQPAAGPTPPPSKAPPLSDFETERNLIRTAMNAVAQTSAKVETILARLGSEPTQEQLAACMFDAAASGATFSVAPTTLTLNTGSAATSGVIIAGGGKGPYHAAWFGTPPDSKVTLDPVNHDGGAPNQATITVKAEKGAGPAVYNLLVTDEGAGRRTVQVIVTNDSQPTARPTTVPPPPPTPAAKDEELEKAQVLLIELKCLPALQANGASSADGVWGPATATAIDNLAVATGDTAENLKTAIGTYGDDDFTKKLLEVLGSAKSAGQLCGA
jgi:hypothetical protein